MDNQLIVSFLADQQLMRVGRKEKNTAVSVYGFPWVAFDLSPQLWNEYA